MTIALFVAASLLAAFLAFFLVAWASGLLDDPELPGSSGSPGDRAGWLESLPRETGANRSFLGGQDGKLPILTREEPREETDGKTT